MKKTIQSSALVWLTLSILIIQPIADFIAFNYHQASFSLLRCVVYYFFILSVSYALLWVTKRIFGQKYEILLALVIGMSIMWIFNHYAIENQLQQLLHEKYRFRFLILVDILSLLVIFWFAYLLNRSKSFHYAFLITILCTTLFNLGTRTLQGQNVISELQSIQQTVAKNNAVTGSPNVYYLIPDGFMGPEMFNTISETKSYIADNLSERGFKVVHNAYSNGSSTILSLSQIFTMRYLFKEGEIINGKKLFELGKLYQSESPVTREFKNRGYKFYRLADGMTSLCVGTEDKCIKKHSYLAVQDIIFMNRTLIPTVLAHKLWWSKGLIPGQMEMNEFISVLPGSQEGPFFLIGHFSLPHPPYRFDANCNRLNYSSIFSSSAAYFESKPGKERFKFYSGQAFCAENLLLQLIDGIQKKDPKAIIIVQSDHGTQDNFDPYSRNVENFSFDEFSQSFNIIYAFYAPESLKKYLYDGFSPINTFRLLFAWLDDKEPDLLPHRSFYGIMNKELLQKVNGVHVLYEWRDAPVPNKENGQAKVHDI